MSDIKYTSKRRTPMPRTNNILDAVNGTKGPGGGSLYSSGSSSGYEIEIIGNNSTTEPNDRNVFSAARSLNEFLSKLKPDTAKEVIDFLKGVKISGKQISNLLLEKGNEEILDENILSALRTIKEIKDRSISRIYDDSTDGHIIFNKGLTGITLLTDKQLEATYSEAISEKTEGEEEEFTELSESISEMSLNEGTNTLGSVDNVSDAADTAVSGSTLYMQGDTWVPGMPKMWTPYLQADGKLGFRLTETNVAPEAISIKGEKGDSGLIDESSLYAITGKLFKGITTEEVNESYVKFFNKSCDNELCVSTLAFTLRIATTEKMGLMSAADKRKLDGMSTLGITKSQVETVLTGNITTHTHDQYELTTKDFTVNNMPYKIYTSAASLPTIYAPTTKGVGMQIPYVEPERLTISWMSSKDFSLNGALYGIYSRETLPAIYAPTSLGTNGQILKSNGTALYWDTLSIKDFTVNGMPYKIYTSAASLPTIYAPTTKGVGMQIPYVEPERLTISWMSSKDFSLNGSLYGIYSRETLPAIYAPTSLGTNGQVLKSNGTALYWATDNNTNNYLSKVSGSGNGIVTLERSGLSALTWNAEHTHTQYAQTTKDFTVNNMPYKIYTSAASLPTIYAPTTKGVGMQIPYIEPEKLTISWMSSKDFSLNGSLYGIYSRETLPAIYAPTSLGTNGQILKSNGTALYWDTLSIKDFTVNGMPYKIYTSAASLPTIYAPTTKGVGMQIPYVEPERLTISWMSSKDFSLNGSLYGVYSRETLPAIFAPTSLGTNGQVLKSNGTALYWANDNNTNNYLSKVSGSGNGIVTLERSGLSALTWNAEHTHTQYAQTTKDFTVNNMPYKIYTSAASLPTIYAPTTKGVGMQIPYVEPERLTISWMSSKDFSLNGSLYGIYSRETLPAIYAPTSLGTNGQILKSNGTALYWANDNYVDKTTNQTIGGLKSFSNDIYVAGKIQGKHFYNSVQGTNNLAHIRICTISVKGQNYVNTPTTFEIVGRSSSHSRTYVSFRLSNSSTPDGHSIVSFAWWGGSEYGQKLTAYKINDTTFEIWLSQSQGWDQFYVTNCVCPAQLTWNGTSTANLPTTYTQKVVASAGSLYTGLLYSNNEVVATQNWITDKRYLTSITKSQIESVLTGNIATHTHSQYAQTTKDFTVNNMPYKIYTSAASLPTIYAPTTKGVGMQIPYVEPERLTISWMSSKDFSLNGSLYGIYSRETLPAIYAPTSLGTNGQVLKSNGTALYWANDNNTNNYLSKISGSGNGIVTLERSGLSALTWNATHTHSYLPLSGGNISGSIISIYQSGSWLNGVRNAAISCNYSGYGAIFNAPVKSGRISLSTYPISNYSTENNTLYFGYISNENIESGTNALNTKMTWDAVTNTLTATNFIGNFKRSGGTKNQFLKANGDIDSNTYLTGITKGQVESVLTGNIVTHTHSQYAQTTKDFTVNNMPYKIYTSAASLPTIYAPTTKGVGMQIPYVEPERLTISWMSSKDFSLNGSLYGIYSRETLPAIYAPTSLGTNGQILKSNGTALYWDTLSIKDFTVNGMPYKIYTSAASLPTIYAPTTKGVGMQIPYVEPERLTISWMSSKDFSLNGSLYGIYSRETLPAIYAPTSLGTNGQVLKSNGTALYWANDNYVDKSSKQTIAGVKTFSSDLVVNNIVYSKGDGNRGLEIDVNGLHFIASTSSWARGMMFYNNAFTIGLGAAVGAYGTGNSLTYYYYGATDYANASMYITPNKYVGLGTKTPAEKLDVVGNVKISGSLIAPTLSHGSGAMNIGNSSNSSYVNFVEDTKFLKKAFINGGMTIASDVTMSSGDFTATNANMKVKTLNTDYVLTDTPLSTDVSRIHFGCQLTSSIRLGIGFYYNTSSSTASIISGRSSSGSSNNFSGSYSTQWMHYGSIRATGSIVGNSSSDRRLKTNISRLENASDILLDLKDKIYEFNYTEFALRRDANLHRHSFGMIYDEVMTTRLQHIAALSSDGYGGINYQDSCLISIMIASQIEQITEMELLKERVSVLEEENETLKDKINLLTIRHYANN